MENAISRLGCLEQKIRLTGRRDVYTLVLYETPDPHRMWSHRCYYHILHTLSLLLNALISKCQK